VTGALPAWLVGKLVRTAPALFEVGAWRAEHWFDGLGMLFSFTLSPGGAVHYRQRQLDCAAARNPAGTAAFGTAMQRSALRRLVTPIPVPTDNTNVNVLQLGDELVAVTETAVQWVIDPDTLAATRQVAWTDALGPLNLIAHPHLDFARGQVLEVATVLGARPALAVLEHSPSGRARREVGRWNFKRVPYAHGFGLTPRSVVLIGQPLTVNPLRMLWSNKGYIEHFTWKESDGTRLGVMDRSTGKVREHTAPAMFVFHTVNAFEEGEDTVLDVIAYADSSIIERLSTQALARGTPELRTRLLRLRLRKGVEAATVAPLTDTRFEFPAIHYRPHNGAAYRYTWGLSLWPEAGESRSQVVKVDVTSGATLAYEDSGWLFGEPVFVPEPQARGEDDGVLLTVGTHRDGERSCLQVLRAGDLAPLARAEVDLPIPLGFHGSFLRATRSA
jgi:carotenoid cleavage dioxygenase-like enzyme